MKTKMSLICLMLASVFLVPLHAEEPRAEALVFLASAVLDDMGNAPDRDKPLTLIENSIAIGVFPGIKKGGYIVGGMFGRGLILYKGTSNKWSNPAFFKIRGGSFGLQAGIQEIDLLLFFLTEESFKQFLDNYVNVGLNITASAGPAGRDLNFNPSTIKMKPEEAIYAYSRSKGLYAGLAVTGSTLLYDFDWSREFYKDSYTPNMILKENEIKNPPKSVETLIKAIKKFEQER